MEKLPRVTLDTTLADLYGPGDRIASIPCGWTSSIDVGKDMPRNKKLLYQIPVPVREDESSHLSRDEQIKFLSLVSQRDAFAAGKMGVVLFTFDAEDGEQPQSQIEAEETMTTLASNQQPELIFCRSPEAVPEELRKYDIPLVAPKLAWDSLTYPCTLGVEESYYLNSKTGTHESGLPTPAATVIRLDRINFDVDSCCEACSSNLSLPTLASCTGPRRSWVYKQVSKIMDVASARSVPFVLKTNQSHGGGGTFIVASASKRDEILKHLENSFLPTLFWALDRSNEHLEPGNILLMDYVSNVVGNWGLTFFILRNGDIKFIAITGQMLEDESHWLGSSISFLEQDKLKQKFEPLMQKVAKWAHGHGYYGPIGADVMESVRNEGEAPQILILDLNVRIPGSLALGFMRNHLSTQRGLHEACLLDIETAHTREDFISNLENECREGRITIVSWYWNPASKRSYATVIVAGETNHKREELVEYVQKQFK